MSALEFSATLRDKVRNVVKNHEAAVKKGLEVEGSILGEDKTKYTEYLKKQTGIYETIFTKQGLDLVHSLLQDAAGTDVVVPDLNFQNFQSQTMRPGDSINSMSNIPDPYLIQQGTNYSTGTDTIKKYLQNIFKDNNDITDKMINDAMSNLDIGHIVGIASKRVSNTFQNELDSNERVLVQKGQEYLDRLLQLLLDLDLATTNSIQFDYGIYANSQKNLNSNKIISVEIQLAQKNQEAGRMVGQVLNLLKKLTNTLAISTSKDEMVNTQTLPTLGGKEYEDWMFKQLNSIANETVKELAKDNFNWLINLPSSPSLISMIESKLVASLDPSQPSKYKDTYSTPNTEIMNGIFGKLDLTQINSLVKVLQTKVKKEKEAINKIASKTRSLRNPKGQFTSLTTIQNLLNQKLVNQVAQNMGSPALNYRTGRFANSIKVDHLQMQRDGAIGIFYTYMKNPYQTFQPGFAQGTTNRDPRKLIGKSIREIAQSLVTSQLRTILV